MSERSKLILIAHNIRSLHNAGSVLRTADAAGVAKVYFTGYTPKPTDEMGRVRPQVAKTALGAEQTVAWEQRKNISALLGCLKKEGVLLIALENAPGATDYREFRPRFPLALILGNEVRGISSATLAKMDAIITIPMRGKKESLNVSVACGIAVYKLLESA